jgi:hypothetical protein
MPPATVPTAPSGIGGSGKGESSSCDCGHGVIAILLSAVRIVSSNFLQKIIALMESMAPPMEVPWNSWNED